jgi:streptogramin lyase
MRNQNIYTSQITGGLVVGAPGNAKPLGTTTNPLNRQVVPYQRAFAVEAQNITGQAIYVQLSIANQPTGGTASFLQFSAETTLQATIPAYSSTSRTVFVTSTNPQASVTVNISQITGIGGSVVTNGLSGSVVLNPDGTNPQITNPNINNPDINNPNINNLEVTNPDINNPNINNPDINNPNINNPDINNPNINNPNINNQTIADASAANPNINNTTIANPDTANPDINNPNINNQDLSDGGTIQDVTYGITNEGNTTSAYTVKLTSTSTPPGGIVFQLIVNRLYQTPAAQSCQLVVQNHWNTVANIINPKVYSPADPNINNPDINNTVPDEATVTLRPAETGYITIRVMNPSPATISFDPRSLIPATVPQAVNTATVLANPGNPNLTAPLVYPQLTIATTSLPPTDRNDPGYSVQLLSIGGKPGTGTWSIASGGLPPGINLSPSGLISGQATTPGSYTVTIQVADTNSPQDVARQTYVLNVSLTPLTVQFTTGEADGVVGQSYSATPLTVMGGTTPYHWTATNLPAGLSINPSTGQITGIPTTANPTGSSVSVTATDAATPAESLSFITTIRIGAAIQISPPTLPNGIIGVPYSEQLSATGGIGTLVFGPAGLPAGGTLSSDGLIQFANPQVPGVSFTASVHDQALPTYQTLSASYTIQFATAVSQVSSLTFVTPPSNTTVSQPMTPAVQVRALNNAATPLPGVSVTLTLSSGPGTLSGTLTQITDATGTATFSNLAINAAGTADTLLAKAGGITATSNAFNITSLTPHACAPIPGAPIAWWPFNGNALDIRGGKPGTILGDFGTQSVFVPAEVGQGFKSTGEGVLISYPATQGLTPVNFTAAAWVRVDAETSEATEQILWQGDSGNTDFTTTPYSLGVLGNGSTSWVTYGAHATIVGTAAPGRIVATFSDGVNELDMFSNTVLQPGVFYYVAITWNGPLVGATIWINGVADQNSGATNLAGLLTPTNPFQIGGIQGSGIGTESFNGVIDELQIFGAGITQFQLSTIYKAGPAGECQAIWFTESNGTTNRIGSIAPDGSNATEYTPPTANSFPYSITAGPDGNVWFTENKPNNIGVFESLGGGAGFGEFPITSATLPGTNSQYGAYGITSGPDGNLWFTESQCVTDPCFVGSITTGGTINIYGTNTADSPPQGIAAGPDGNLWFTEAGAGTRSHIARITTGGTVTEYQTPTSGSAPGFITTGGDGNLWFTEGVVNQIGVITTGGAFPHEYPIPAGVNAVGISAAGTGYQIGDIITVVQAGASGGTFSVSAVDTNGGVIVSPPGLNLQSIGTGYSLSTAPTNTTGGHGTGLQVNVSSTSNSFGPAAITLGPDGNVWFVAASGVANNIIEVSPAGQFTAYPVPIGGSAEFITAGPDGNIWYTDNFNNAIARLIPSTGVTTEFPTPTSGSGPWGIGIGPTVAQTPAKPTNVSGSSPFGSPVISWTASVSTGVIGYNVYRANSVNNPNGPFTLVNSSPVTSSPFTDLGASTTSCGTNPLYYFVTTVGEGEWESPSSNETSAPLTGPC